MYRLSFSFSTSTTFGPCCAGGWTRAAIERPPSVSRTTSTYARLTRHLLVQPLPRCRRILARLFAISYTHHGSASAALGAIGSVVRRPDQRPRLSSCTPNVALSGLRPKLAGPADQTNVTIPQRPRGADRVRWAIYAPASRRY